ncbi:MAG: hypothetical protein JSR86_17285 [Proteobacteria bacterium]|nr:hypothetical protein [Pseudomonadota bacterium]
MVQTRRALGSGGICPEVRVERRVEVLADAADDLGDGFGERGGFGQAAVDEGEGLVVVALEGGFAVAGEAFWAVDEAGVRRDRGDERSRLHEALWLVEAGLEGQGDADGAGGALEGLGEDGEIQGVLRRTLAHGVADVVLEHPAVDGAGDVHAHLSQLLELGLGAGDARRRV